jgi:hypothetical protein
VVWQPFICHRTGLTLRGLTREQSARIDTTWESILPENFLLGVGQGNQRSVCCGVFSYQKWHWTKTVQIIFGSPFWLSRLSDRSGTVCHELRNRSSVGWWIRRNTKLYATKPFHPMRLQQLFFCLNGITTGIAHPPTKKAKVTVEYKCGTHVTTNKCTHMRVSLGMVWGFIAGCVTESNSLLNWVQRIGGRQAEPLVWDVRSARSLFAKSAGKRGTINMHNFT